MKTYLVTGGAGFIGANFVHLAHRRGVRVVNLDALTYAGNKDTLAALHNDARHIFVHGDIGDRGLIAHLLATYRPQAIVHFAAESHVDRSIDNAAPFIQTNIVGTFELLQATLAHWRTCAADERRALRFLHVSTDEVFGALGSAGYFTEASPYAPNSPYSASKAASDHLVRAYHHTYGLPTLITHCSNNYGPYQFPEKLIPLMILNAQAGRPLPIYGDGQHVRDWLYVEDHCQALLRVLDAGHPGASYAIGGNCERSNLDVAKTLCALLDDELPASPFKPHAALIEFVADRPGHDRRYAIDATALREELGWTAQENFHSGLTKTVRWYIDNDAWCRRVQDGSYRRERLGLQQSAAAVSLDTRA